MMRVIASAGVLLAAGLICSRATPQTEPSDIALVQQAIPASTKSEDGPLPLLAPYRALMTGLTGWAAYGLFKMNSNEEPLSDKDWSDAGMAAVNLTAIATLLSLEGSGKNDKRRHDDPEWKGMAADMQNASVLVASAVLKKDRDEFKGALGLLGNTCQTCHARFMKMPPLNPPAPSDMAR
ncbi:MAG: hypothetical protein QM773_06850 [Hyphomonadaceae bacterium]